VLDAWPGVRYVIEPKSDQAVEPLADAVRRTGVLDRVCIGSFSDARVKRMRHLLGQRLCTSLGRRGVLRLRLASLGLPVGGFVEAAAQVPVRYRGLPVVDRQLLAAARSRGLQVQVWTVNQESEMERLIDLGVDGIITDRPAMLKTVLSRRGLWHG
jgi:glycerophosphoryl diester phosphodiesterase